MRASKPTSISGSRTGSPAVGAASSANRAPARRLSSGYQRREHRGRHRQKGEDGNIMATKAPAADKTDNRVMLRVLTAVKRGDFSVRMPVTSTGQAGQVAVAINDIIESNQRLERELRRLSKHVGKEGLVKHVSIGDAGGGWAATLDSINDLIEDVVRPNTEMARVISAVAKGDLTQTMPTDIDGSRLQGQFLETARIVNTMVNQLRSFSSEVTRVAREVGTEGKLGGQADVKGVVGTWKDLTDNVNLMAGQLTNQIRNIADVTTAVANGDLSRKITVDVHGEILELKNTINTMVDQLNAFANEVTRVAREVGTEGKLGGQAEVTGVGGTWKDLTDKVNSMAGNLTSQVRNIAEVTTAVANGDLSKKITVDVQGEILELKNTINSMTETLAIFAEQVTSVARDVGVEGRLGGQARVPGAAGTWRNLTDNVNQLSATLTTQVRAIADVATAVTKGDLTRSIGVEASGEVAVLKDNINEMIRNLKETTEKNTEQDWLKTNLARFARMLQGQRDPMTVSKMILSELAPLVNAEHGVFYGMVGPNGNEVHLDFQAGYAYKRRKEVPMQFRVGEGLVGQCAFEKRRILITDVPSDYVKITSGLGESKPLNILVLPVVFEGDVRAVIELASFQRFSQIHQDFLDQLMESIGIVLNNIEANSRTEELLKQSQSLANELQSQQDQLQHTNEELAEKARQLAQQNAEIEQKRNEVEVAKSLVEEKAEQLEITSRYKSEFLANMSHELRTPLNSLLILAQELADNPEGNLLPKQTEYATIIRSSGTDLLRLINDILDLSKIESGTGALEITDWPLSELPPLLERTFPHVAEATRLDFSIDLRPGLPASIPTDPQRLQQVLNNLLSNAFKFTEMGRVEFRAELATSGWSPSHEALNRAEAVIAMSVTDTGIGIPREQQQTIFEAFAQGDGTTSRKYGGTGLGLSICRELTRLLAGEITLESRHGAGSTFTLYLPIASPVVAWSGVPREASSSNGSAGIKSPQTEPAGPNRSRKRIAVLERAPMDAHATQHVLVVEDDPTQREHVVKLMEPLATKPTAVATGEEAVAALGTDHFDCIVVDLGLPGMSGWQVIDHVRTTKKLRSTPVLVYTAKELTRKEELKLGRATKTIVVKEVRSPERLRDEVGAILSRGAQDEMADHGTVEIESSLAGKKVLVVDDDVRNIFALTALLERQGMDVTSSDNGVDALTALAENNDIDIAVVDVMMPDMDGYATMSRMRSLPFFETRPIIALTAKAMKGDREKCIEAGASDYIAKPVDSSHLVGMLRSWLSH